MKYTVHETVLGKDLGIEMRVNGNGRRDAVQMFQFDPGYGLKKWRSSMGDAENVAFSIIRDFLMRPGSGFSQKGRELTEAIRQTGAVPCLARTKLFNCIGTSAVIDESEVLHAVQSGKDWLEPDTKTRVRPAPSWLSETIYESGADGGPVRKSAADIMNDKIAAVKAQGVNPWTGKPLNRP